MLILRGRRIVLPDGERPASLYIDRGQIVGIRDGGDSAAGDDVGDDAAEIVDVGDLVVSPGVVDTHVHVNEPGRTEWEGFDSATRAAAAGGVTAIVDMPLNSVPATTTVAALEEKRRAARGQCHVDVGCWGGVVPGHEASIDPLVDAGVRGFKCFLVPSGVDEFPPVDERTLRLAMPALARRQVPLLVHAESPARVREYRADSAGQAASYRGYAATRPAVAEVDAIRLMARLARDTGAHVHVVHVSSAGGVDAVADARAESTPITAETCPHYLTFAATEIPDGATEYKCAPPIRDDEDREALWRGLRRGTLSLVASDHSPAPAALKPAGDFVRSWGGIASLELALAAVWTGARARGFSASDMARWMSEAPASLAGWSDRKGRIAPGQDADLVVWDADAEFTVDPRRLQQRHKITPYAGRRLRGVVRMTFVRGERVWDGGRLSKASSGQLL
jgi:allantoinase